MIQNKTAYWLLGVIVVAYAGIGALYAIYTPAWQAPDEPAHYNAIAQVATDGCCPVIAPGDWDSALLEKLKAGGFPENADLSSIEYEDHQPPLYYLIGAAVFLATGGSLLALRLMSVAMGTGAVIAAYVALARLYPRRKTLALSAAAFVAFLPQHVAILASVNNDSLGGMVLGILIVTCVTYAGNPVRINVKGQSEAYPLPSRPHAAALGGLAGVAFLTKLTLYLPAVIIVAIAIIARWRVERRDKRWLATETAWAAGMALAFGALWWIRNITVYGWPDLFGLARHNAVVVGQLRTAELADQIGIWPYIQQYATTVFNSFFGQFGWMGVPMPAATYYAILAFMLATLAGAAMLATRFRDRLEDYPSQGIALGVMGGALLAGLVGLIQYNFTFVQFQGRYLYPGLIPVAALVALGWQGWAFLIGRGMGAVWERWLAWLPVAALAWMPALAVWALFKWIVPNLK